MSAPDGIELDARIHIGVDGGTYATGRVPGHGLRARGEPYLAVDCYTGRCATNLGATIHQENSPTVDSVRGQGHAVCSCGAISPHLPNGIGRKRWHRMHKARVLLAQPEPPGQPRPVSPEDVA